VHCHVGDPLAPKAMQMGVPALMMLLTHVASYAAVSSPANPSEAAKAASRPIGWPELAKPGRAWQSIASNATSTSNSSGK